jgi:hypothetical protein
MSSNYRVTVFLTAVDKERVVQLREVLQRIIKGAGKEPLREIMRRAHGGERMRVYQTNNDKNALEVAQSLIAAGAGVAVEGLKPPEDAF